jgi:hypothetical protein
VALGAPAVAALGESVRPSKLPVSTACPAPSEAKEAGTDKEAPHGDPDGAYTDANSVGPVHWLHPCRLLAEEAMDERSTVMASALAAIAC